MDNEAEQLLSRVERLLSEKKLLAADAERIKRRIVEKQEYRRTLDADLASGKIDHSEHSKRLLAMHGEYANLDRSIDDAMVWAKRKKKQHELLIFIIVMLAAAGIGVAIYSQKYIHDHEDVETVQDVIKAHVK